MLDTGRQIAPFSSPASPPSRSTMPTASRPPCGGSARPVVRDPLGGRSALPTARRGPTTRRCGVTSTTGQSTIWPISRAASRLRIWLSRASNRRSLSPRGCAHAGHGRARPTQVHRRGCSWLRNRVVDLSPGGASPRPMPWLRSACTVPSCSDRGFPSPLMRSGSRRCRPSPSICCGTGRLLTGGKRPTSWGTALGPAPSRRAIGA